MSFGSFCWSLLISSIIVGAGCIAWHIYKLRELVAKLTDENARMRRYLNKRATGDDLPFLPLGTSDDR